MSQFTTSDFKLKTLEEFNNLVNETKSLVDAQRSYLKKHSLPKRKSYFIEEMQNVKNIAYWENHDIYSQVDSDGFHFIEFGGYVIRLKIVQMNGKPKILDLFLLSD